MTPNKKTWTVLAIALAFTGCASGDIKRDPAADRHRGNFGRDDDRRGDDRRSGDNDNRRGDAPRRHREGRGHLPVATIVNPTPIPSGEQMNEFKFTNLNLARVAAIRLYAHQRGVYIGAASYTTSDRPNERIPMRFEGAEESRGRDRNPNPLVLVPSGDYSEADLTPNNQPAKTIHSLFISVRREASRKDTEFSIMAELAPEKRNTAEIAVSGKHFSCIDTGIFATRVNRVVIYDVNSATLSVASAEARSGNRLPVPLTQLNGEHLSRGGRVHNFAAPMDIDGLTICVKPMSRKETGIFKVRVE